MNYCFSSRVGLMVVLLLTGCTASAAVSRGYKAMNPTLTNEFSAINHCSERIDEAKNILTNILAARSPQNAAELLQSYDHLMILLGGVGAEAGLFSQVHPDKATRELAEACEQDLSQFTTALSLNRDLYNALNAVNMKGLDPLTTRMLTKELDDFRRGGVALDDSKREQVKKLHEELTKISQDFGRNIREDVRFIQLDSVDDLAGLPQDYINAHKPNAEGKIRISTDYPDLISFMQYAHSGEHRKALWMANLNRGNPKNIEVLQQMINKRHELAQLLGYKSYAQYVVEDKMIKTPERVGAFIDDIKKDTDAAGKVELAELLAEKQIKDAKATQVFGYEYSYLSEQVKRRKLSFDSAAMRPYFEYKSVKKGLLDLVSEMYDVEFKQAVNAPVWHSSVEAYDVFEDGKLMGRIYLDMHPRDGKYKHAAQFTVRNGVLGQQLPEGALICNFPDPNTSSEPALMDYDEVVTFFHEFGHLMHHIFGGQQKWSRFSGVATEWDFVEAPSQFFEEWAADAQVLQRFAKHVSTGQTISDAQVAQLKAANEYGKALHAQQQMFYAALSFQYYNRDPATFGPLDLQVELQNSYSPFKYVPGTHFNLSFGHLDDYSAIYYTYMWSLVIAKDLFTPFKKDGLLNKNHSLAFKKYVLEPGGSKDAGQLVNDFLGRDYNFSAFREWLSEKN